MTQTHIIIPAFQHPERLAKLLQSLSNTTKSHVDAKVHIEWNDLNILGPVGFTVTVNNLMNQAISDPECKHVFLSGDDVEILTPEWHDRLIDYANKHPDVGMIGPQEIVARNGGVLAPKTGEEMGLWRYGWGTLKPGEGQIVEIPFPNFAFVYIRADVIRKIGVLDLGYSPGIYDDYDYGVRAWLAGYRSVWYPHVQFNHIRGATWSEMEAKGIYQYPTKQGAFFNLKWSYIPILEGEPDMNIIRKLKERSERQEWEPLDTQH